MAISQTLLTARLDTKIIIYASGATFRGILTDDGSGVGADSIVLSSLNGGTGSVTLLKSSLTGFGNEEGY